MTEGIFFIGNTEYRTRNTEYRITK